MIPRYVYFIALVVLAVGVAVATKEPLTGWPQQADHNTQLKFSHSFHVKEQGIGCADCHSSAPESTTPKDHLLPNHEICQTCHEEQLSDNCAFCHNDPDNIVPIQHPDWNLNFSHELHAGRQTIACETCHEGLSEVADATAANYPPMTTCTSCHSSKQVSTNCETCHLDFASLIPADHRKGDFRSNHSMEVRTGMLDVSCSSCHTESFCQDCHTGIELKGFVGTKDRMADPSVRSSTKDSPKQLRLQQAHSLNYRYTHGIDARGKATECATCHEPQSFCAECHDAGGNITQLKIAPSTHRRAGFVLIGKGSGGGLHAQLARRDLENCVSCHDVEGSDPVCARCHTENGGIR